MDENEHTDKITTISISSNYCVESKCMKWVKTKVFTQSYRENYAGYEIYSLLVLGRIKNERGVTGNSRCFDNILTIIHSDLSSEVS
jgi:hypothetical protein